MSVHNDDYRIQDIASAGETNFGFDFRIFQDTDIDVYLTPVGNVPDPASDILILNTDYTVNILDQSGSITLIIPADAGDIITLQGNIPATRTFDYGLAGAFTGPSLDQQLDKITITIGENKTRQLTRGLTYNVSEQLEDGDVTLPKLDSNQYWIKNTAGNLVAGECTDTDGCSTLRSELVSQTAIAPGTDNVGYYDAVDGGQTLTEKLFDMSPQKDNRPFIKNTADETKLIKMDADAITTGTTRTIFMPDHDVDLGDTPLIGLPPAFLYGYAPDLDAGGDPLHDVIIGSGECRDSTDSTDIKFESVMIKQIDAPWAQGDDQGGFPSALTLTAYTWYHIFVIMKEDGTIDFGFDDNLGAANLLLDATDFIYYRRIGSVIPDGSLELISYIYRSENSRRIWYFTPTRLILNTNNPSLGAHLFNAGTPTGIETYAMLNILLQESGAAANELYISNPDTTNEVPNVNSAPLGTLSVRDNKTAMQKIEERTDLTSQLRFRVNSTSSATTVRIVTLGWSEHL